MFVDWDGISIRDAASVNRDVTSSLNELIQSRTIDHQVFDNRKRLRAPRLHGDGVAVLELTHVQLACCGVFEPSVRMSVDI